MRNHGGRRRRLQSKIFWATFTIVSLIVDFNVSMMWSLILQIPLLVLSWWFAYRSGWFE